jgi:hypothetical protein
MNKFGFISLNRIAEIHAQRAVGAARARRRGDRIAALFAAAHECSAMPFTAKLGQIESSVDLPHKVIFGDRIAKTKLVEQLTLVTLQTAHHGSTSPRFASAQRNHASTAISTDFCNKIGTNRTNRASLVMSVVRGRPEVAVASADV